MSVKVLIPTPLRPFTDELEVVEIQANSVSELLKRLTDRYQGLQKHLFDETGRFRSFVNVYVNDEDIRSLSQWETPLKETDVVSIIPAIAGG